MAMELTVVSVTLADREDGGLRVYSDDLPGLILSGADREHTCSLITVAIQEIFAYQGVDVTVRPAKPLSDVLKSASPRNVDMHVQQFVIEMKIAA
jgi:hypothetical protein